MRRVVALLTAIGSLLLLAACEDDGDESAPAPTTVASAEERVAGQQPAPAGDADLGATPPETRPEPSARRPGERPEGIRFDVSQWRTDFGRHTVPLDEFWQALPFKDGIVAIDEPSLVGVTDARDWLEGFEPVIELELHGRARAYPLKILTWHEIVNDTIAGVPIAVTFCPLCYTALAFERRLDGRLLDFGVSGNLRNSDLVMYDRQTESWWQQFNGEAVVGELAGAALAQVSAAIVGFDDFATRHPDGEVLSNETRHDFDYDYNPYVGYDRIDRPVVRVHANADDDRLLPRERVVLLDREVETVAVPFTALEKRRRIEVELAGERVEVLWVEDVRSALDEISTRRSDAVGSADVRSLATGERVAFDTPFWFAVAAFKSGTRIVTDTE